MKIIQVEGVCHLKLVNVKVKKMYRNGGHTMTIYNTKKLIVLIGKKI